MWRGALWMKKGLDQKRIRHLVMEESLMLLTKMRRGLRQRNGCRWRCSRTLSAACGAVQGLVVHPKRWLNRSA
ncbi:hypothetical protein TPY_3108 [Sulfobacillus acidophilus TPY]|uniref:Uncharacterized protein n=1 Tax=Sulfobacillus acidophilus (strain ATCC 700253 / DSM 10332 / NAL) TaxID=679936 RepID=G8U157_SULAD|nr:hypothetical protein TPY_3108 [Sulfobacillus acidophilus TPY]AEW04290.1 hypothetical protein Sulac_0787 [Sulfobacillus acidophilus DSM 10332]